MSALEFITRGLLGDGAVLIEVPSDEHGFPRLVASHYLQATEAHDDLADWGFYRRVVSQANWLVASALNDTTNESKWRNELIDSDSLRYMGEWSDGKDVEPLRIWDDALNSARFGHCADWTGRNQAFRVKTCIPVMYLQDQVVYIVSSLVSLH